MEITLTLSVKKQQKTIPQYVFRNADADQVVEESTDKLGGWLETKNFEESVFACFMTFRNLPTEQLRDEQCSFFISSDHEGIVNYCFDELSKTYQKWDKNFSVFEFESYKEAFKFCIDLKEGF